MCAFVTLNKKLLTYLLIAQSLQRIACKKLHMKARHYGAADDHQRSQQ